MHSRSVFESKPDFKLYKRSLSSLYHFLHFKAWLISNRSKKFIYNVCLISRTFWYRVWATQFWIWFASLWSHQSKTFKIQSSPQIATCDYEKCVWNVNLINYDSDYLILFLDWKLLIQFSLKPLDHFVSSLSLYILLFVLFSMIYNI